MFQENFSEKILDEKCIHGNRSFECEKCHERMNKIFQLLLSPDQEHEVAKERKEKEFINIRKGEKEIVIAGTAHVFSRESIEKAEKAFKELQPEIILVEGTLQSFDETLSGDEVLKRHGEQRYFSWLGNKQKIDVQSWDTSWKERLQNALPKHGLEAVIGWIIASAAKSFINQNHGKPPTPEQIMMAIQFVFTPENIASLNQEFPEIKNVHNIDFDAVFRRFTGGKGISELNEDLAEKLASPWYRGVTNDVIRSMNQFRDENAIRVIDIAAKKYQKIFVIAGNDHVITWEPALAELFKQDEP